MRSFIGILIIVLFTACVHNKSVQVSGRVETHDTIVSFRVNGKKHEFKLDDKHYFSGKIELEKATYATFAPAYTSVFLTPGEDLEINYDETRNSVTSLQYKGTLSAINNYLKDQYWFIVPFDHKLYQLEEGKFVAKMTEMINVNILLLEAKNLGEEFTNLERERIRYRVAEQAMRYPTSHFIPDSIVDYKPTYVFDNFISGFDINNEELLSFNSYQRFLLDYIYYKGQNMNVRRLVDYILTNVNSLKVRDYVLSEIVYSYFRDNGLKDSDYLLSVCWNEVSDTSKMVKVKELVDRWRKLSAGVTAPDVALINVDGEEVSLKDFKGDYLYICAWSMVYGDNWKTEGEAWKQLVHEYQGKKIRFMTFATSTEAIGKMNDMPGEHFAIKDLYAFYNQYMISTFPRYLLVDPNGRIFSVNAPNPSSSAKLLLRSIGL